MLNRNYIRISYLLLCLLATLGSATLYAQSLAQQKGALRYEIDAKRMGVNMDSEDALPRSREFKRIDSTYYVGWLFEGVYKFNHSADYLGFKNASLPLERALKQIERDYRKELATRTSDLATYFPVYRYQIDYTVIAYYLNQCYSNMEEPEKNYALMQRVLRWNFQRDYQMDAYNWLGWITHRNRFYTSSKFSFLKNTINDNERLAHSYLDSSLRRIAINRRINSSIYQPGYDDMEKLGVYHYKCVLYSYALKIDSAAYYFELMRKSPIFPHNNYATFRAICGDFREAEKEYEAAITQDAGDKRLKEWAYYSSILDIYKAQPKRGIELMKEMIKANGSTPGFGWYNIALARCMMYDGQISEANRYTDKAAEFKELHIGTTLGQSHYDFSTQLVKLMYKESVWERQKFENKNWWYNPVVLARMTKLLGEKYMQQFLIINQFAQNPERDRVIYKLFSTESTVSWDEVWQLIKDFSTRFFLERFRKEAQTDERKYINKYFRFIVARLEMKQGNYTEARKTLDAILRDTSLDQEYEKLFLARIYQAQAECAIERKDNAAANDWMYRMYQTYPQLIPDAGLRINMNLHLSGTVDNAVVERLKACNINWAPKGSTAPEAYLIFSGTGSKKKIEYYVLDRGGNYIVPKQARPYKQADEVGVAIAYALFGIGGVDANAEDK